jgi:hypothetical protein
LARHGFDTLSVTAEVFIQARGLFEMSARFPEPPFTMTWPLETVSFLGKNGSDLTIIDQRTFNLSRPLWHLVPRPPVMVRKDCLKALIPFWPGSHGYHSLTFSVAVLGNSGYNGGVFMDDEKVDRTGILRSQIDELFGKPVLLQGEDREKYRQLRKQVWGALDPQSLFDGIEVQEAVDSIWEAQRFQKHATKLVDAEHQNAFRHLVSSESGYISAASEKWLNNVEKRAAETMTDGEVYKKIGLSEELVQARSVLLAADNYSVLCRLVSNRIAARKATLKDYARRKRMEAKDARLSAKAKLQHRNLANDNRPAERETKPHKKSST